MTNSSPIIGIPADRRELSPHVYHMAGEKYLTAVTEAIGGVPIIIPVLSGHFDMNTVLELVDGILLTGSYSNIEPAHYDGPTSAPGTLHDSARDAVTLPLIRTAIERGIPLFGICRGFQEMNVALGGSLHQRVHEVPGRHDHREDATQPLDIQYGPAHAVSFTEGGLLHSLTGKLEGEVNSIHWQGVDRLAPGLNAEATAPDGLVEAFTVNNAPGFTLAVQWHPEWRATQNPLSMAMFKAFGDACRQRAKVGN
ncbi:MAG: gamma-glutamyl-gamma-aminobutyrate hydrolase family protein [Acidihalobacter sp.]